MLVKRIFSYCLVSFIFSVRKLRAEIWVPLQELSIHRCLLRDIFLFSTCLSVLTLSMGVLMVLLYLCLIWSIISDLLAKKVWKNRISEDIAMICSRHCMISF